MKHFKECPIEKDVVILASGESLKEVPKEDLQAIADKYFVIALNFVDVIQPHMRIWSDTNVTDWLDERDKDCIYVSRKKAFHPPNTHDLLESVDYWFDDIEEGYDNNYKWTLYWLLELLRTYHSDKNIFIFGMDCKNNLRHRYVNGSLTVAPSVMNNSKKMPEAFRARKNNDRMFFAKVYNLNPESNVRCLKFKNYKELLVG